MLDAAPPSIVDIAAAILDHNWWTTPPGLPHGAGVGGQGIRTDERLMLGCPRNLLLSWKGLCEWRWIPRAGRRCSDCWQSQRGRCQGKISSGLTQGESHPRLQPEAVRSPPWAIRRCLPGEPQPVTFQHGAIRDAYRTAFLSKEVEDRYRRDF